MDKLNRYFGSAIFWWRYGTGVKFVSNNLKWPESLLINFFSVDLVCKEELNLMLKV